MASAAVITFVDPASGSFVVIDFDVITTENHKIGARVSDHPVEIGANISDHVRPELLALSITGVVSDTPIRRSVLPGDPIQVTQSASLTTTSKVLQSPVSVSGGPGGGLLNDTVESLPGVGAVRRFQRTNAPPPVATPAVYREAQSAQSFQYRSFPDGSARVRQVFEQLESVCRNGIPVEVVTSVRTYPNMLITSIDASREATESLAFEMSLRELRIAEVQNTTITKTRAPAKKPKPAEKRGEAKTNQGDQAQGWDVGGSQKSTTRALVQGLVDRAGKTLAAGG